MSHQIRSTLLRPGRAERLNALRFSGLNPKCITVPLDSPTRGGQVSKAPILLEPQPARPRARQPPPDGFPAFSYRKSRARIRPDLVRPICPNQLLCQSRELSAPSLGVRTKVIMGFLCLSRNDSTDKQVGSGISTSGCPLFLCRVPLLSGLRLILVARTFEC